MRKLISLLLPIVCLSIPAWAEYTDHRGHNVDSLETVMAGWTAKEIEDAGDDDLRQIARNLDELMYGFNQTNGVKSEYYARMLLKIAERKGWRTDEQAAAKNIGQHFWAKEKYDSAAFYYGIAMKAAESLPESESRDNALSQMYGTLGNLYSMMDSIDVAMEYYEMAGVLFKAHEWHNSSSVLYYNMGETMRGEGKLKSAETYYKESLNYSLLAKDSLAIATAYKGLGSLYMEMHRTAKAMRYLDDANRYFADHEKEELQYRMESLDYTGQVLAMQNKRLTLIILLLVALALLAAATMLIVKRFRLVTQEKEELTEVLETAVESIGASQSRKDYQLKPREKDVLDFIAKGYTNAQIAEAMSLSPETIKWYKKKFFAMFEASNSADLVRIAKEEGVI